MYLSGPVFSLVFGHGRHALRVGALALRAGTVLVGALALGLGGVGCRVGFLTWDCDGETVRVGALEEYGVSALEVAEDMDFYCRGPDEPTRGGVDAATLLWPVWNRRGSAEAGFGVPLVNAVAHEGLHWALWAEGVDNGCDTHDESCGWAPQAVEEMQILLDSDG